LPHTPLEWQDFPFTRRIDPQQTKEVIDLLEEEKNATMWTSLPQIRQLLGLGWHRHLPPEAGVTFTSIAILGWSGARGGDMWRWLEKWYSEAERYPLDPRQACAKEDVERRFKEEYGKPYEKSVRGMVELLVDLGLVYRETEEGEEVLKIPELLPLPEDCLKLSKAERELLQVMRSECPFCQ